MEEEILNAALKALASRERRDVVETLLDNEMVTIPSEETDRVMSLAHNHLPQLAAADFIEYSHTEEGIMVQRGEDFEEILPLFNTVVEELETP